MTNPVFEIRAHHLNTFGLIYKNSFSPSDVAAAIVNEQRNNWYFDPEYVEDVVGKTVTDSLHVRKRWERVFAQFVALSDTGPVRINIGGKDGICNGCHVGSHCIEKGHELSIQAADGPKRVFEKEIDDMIVLDAFLRKGRSLIDQGKIEPIFGFPVEEVDFAAEPSSAAIPILESHGVSFQLPVRTNAGFVKAVLSHCNSPSAAL